MRVRFTPKKVALVIGLLVVMPLVMANHGCDEHASTSSAQIAYIVGDGLDGHDAKVHRIVYPGEKVEYNYDSEDVKYVPANSRNFIINPKGELNANSAEIGDRHNAVFARTSTGTKVKLWLEINWTLNQEGAALLKFYDVCQKYKCFTDQENSNDVNFAPKGWNGWLGEQVSPSIDDTIKAVMSNFNDDTWKLGKHYDEIAKAAAARFWSDLRGRTGYTENLICGSGSSIWLDGNKRTNFRCTTVRFKIRDIQPVQQELDRTNDAETKAEQDKALNKKRLEAAKLIYGDKAEETLAMIDAIRECKAARATCVIGLGGQQPGVNVDSGGDTAAGGK